MSKTLVFIEHTKGALKRSSQELLSAARKFGQPVVAVAFGQGTAGLLKEVSKFGALELHAVEDSALDQYNPELFASNLTPLITAAQATVILASASSIGKDLFPKIAARLKCGVVSDAVEISGGADLTVKKPMYSGKVFAKVGFSNSPQKIILMRPNQLPIEESPAETKLVAVAVVKPDLKAVLKEIVRGTSEKLDLTEANVVISGGRGLKEAKNFKILEDLAQVLGATVGASRAVVDAGWVSHGMQVGQTGKTVAPSLYIAVGISGAIQHLAGMSGSKVIVAINSDPSAPIFQKATYGIVGDALEVVPQLTEAFKQALH